MTDPLVFRAAAAADAPAVAALHVASWRSAYRGILTDAYLAGPVAAERLALWRHRLEAASPDEITLLAESGGAPSKVAWAGPRNLARFQGEAKQDGVGFPTPSCLVGFSCLVFDEDPHWGSLVNNLHADPAHRGLGIGRRLMRVTATHAAGRAPERPIHLFCLEENAPARAFYARLGGEVVERCDADEPDGGRYPALRYFWPTPAALLQGCG